MTTTGTAAHPLCVTPQEYVDLCHHPASLAAAVDRSAELREQAARLARVQALADHHLASRMGDRQRHQAAQKIAVREAEARAGATGRMVGMARGLRLGVAVGAALGFVVGWFVAGAA